MSERTPRPWRIEGPDDFGDYNILHNEGKWAIGAVVSNLNPPELVRANAELIVRAVNNHDKLVAALERIIAANKDFCKSMWDGWEGDPLSDACDAAAAVLAEVRGK